MYEYQKGTVWWISKKPNRIPVPTILWKLACTRGLSSYTMTPSLTVGWRVRVCTVVSLFSWMYSLGLFSRLSRRSTSLFLPTPWIKPDQSQQAMREIWESKAQLHTDITKQKEKTLPPSIVADPDPGSHAFYPLDQGYGFGKNFFRVRDLGWINIILNIKTCSWNHKEQEKW
jgi:hypothetical protein